MRAVDESLPRGWTIASMPEVGAIRFTITRTGVVPDLVIALVLMAVREADLVFGPARRKIETEIRVSGAKRICAIRGGTDCGEYLARLFCGFLIRQVGEDGFLVKQDGRRPLLRKGEPG